MKTLKDLIRFEDDHSLMSREDYKEGYSGNGKTVEDFDKWVADGATGYSDNNELKQSAIEWVEHLKNDKRVNNCQAIGWIKHFFNLTEDDIGDKL